jgi:hypothetical protein
MNPKELDSRENNLPVSSIGREDSKRVQPHKDLRLQDLAAILFHVKLPIDRLNLNLCDNNLY